MRMDWHVETTYDLPGSSTARNKRKNWTNKFPALKLAHGSGNWRRRKRLMRR
jgi:hypothetical protein